VTVPNRHQDAGREVNQPRRNERGEWGPTPFPTLREMKLAKGKNTLLWPGAKLDQFGEQLPRNKTSVFPMERRAVSRERRAQSPRFDASRASTWHRQLADGEAT